MSCESYRGGRCMATEHMDFCGCQGDVTDCDFFPEKRKEANDHKKTMSLIHDIVDKAVRSKDRYVSIYCGKNGPSVNVYPMFEEDESVIEVKEKNNA